MRLAAILKGGPMVVVFVNSLERAMLLATRLDGVALKGTDVRIRADNYNEHKEDMKDELLSTGYLCSYFHGNQYLFVYSDGLISLPSKMVDYDPSYSKILNRPVPFLPSPMERRTVDTSFDERIPVYKRIYEDALKVINAATFDMDGELAFFQFQRAMETPKLYQRVNIRMLEATSIYSCFNAPQDGTSHQVFSLCCQLWERFSWLVSCNVTDVIAQYSENHLLLPAGFMEAMVLFSIKDANDAGPRYLLRTSDGQFSFEGTLYTPDDGVKSAVIKDAVVHRDRQANIRLFNVFTLQAAAARRLKILPNETLRRANALYDLGFISFPSYSDAIPWQMKLDYTKACSVINMNPVFQGQFIPRDVELFRDWDEQEDAFGQTGIIVTPRQDVQSLPSDLRQLYELICQNNIDAIKRSRTEYTISLSLDVDGKNVDFQAAYTAEGTQIPKLDAQMLAGKRCTVSPTEAKKTVYLYDILDSVCKKLKNSFLPDQKELSRTIENLIAWKQISVGQDMSVSLTAFGKSACRYLSMSQLAKEEDSVVWPNRLSTVLTGDASPATYKADIDAFVTDLCCEVQDAANELNACGGVMLSECRCPMCQSKGSKGSNNEWHCSNSSCHFKIPGQLFGHTMSNLDIVQLLTRHRTSSIRDFQSNKGAYAARLIVTTSGKIERTFLSPYKCPLCGGELSEYMWGVKCKTSDCSFSLNKSICKYELTDDDEAALLSMQKTKPLHLTNSKGKEFVALLYLNEHDGSVKFEFPSKTGRSK